MKSTLVFSGRFLVTAFFVAMAGILSWHLWDYYMNAPWTRDGKVRADIVHLASDVSGIVSEVDAHDNQTVAKGDVIFRIDQARFLLALQQSEAALSSAKAALDSANSDVELYNRLGDGSVSQQKLRQSKTAVEQAEGALQQATVARDIAKLNLDRSTVRAPVNGELTNFSLRPGDYIASGTSVTAVIDHDSYYVAGYFEENKLDRIAVGDPVIVKLMGSDKNLTGHVASVAGGIEDRERSDTSGLLANVTPTFTWVRLAQRVPVRVALDKIPDGVSLVAGRTASVALVN